MATKKLPDTVSETALKEQQDPESPTTALEQQAEQEKKAQREEMSSKPLSEEKVKTSNPLEARRTAHVQLPGSEPGAGIFPDQMSRRGASDAVYGGYVTVTDGEHKGRRGVYHDNVAFDDQGYPTAILVRTRDSAHELLTVPYDAVAASGPQGR